MGPRGLCKLYFNTMGLISEVLQDTFYRVFLNASINVTLINPEDTIQNWVREPTAHFINLKNIFDQICAHSLILCGFQLSVTLNPDDMTVLNFVMMPKLHM